MRAASQLSRERPAAARDQKAPVSDGLRSFAATIGNRAFAQHVARCSGGSGARSRGGKPCCAECAEQETALADAVRARRRANSLTSPRAWVDSSAIAPSDVVTAAADAGSGAPACPAGNSAKKDTVSIQPVVIADDDGKNATTAPAMDKVIRIWKKCCVDITVAATKTIRKTDYRTLDESPNDTPTAEETKMFGDGGSYNGIQVYVPVEFKMDDKTGKDVNGGGATYEAGKAHPKVVVVEGSLPEVVAHEVGHAMGHLDHDDNDTVMKPTGKHDVANKSAVSKGVCTSARTGSVLTAGADDCCMDPT